MQLSELLSGVEIVTCSGDLSIPVTGVTNDSRQVEPGFLFVSIQGFKKDGHSFILDAIRRGAVAIVTEKPLPNTPSVPTVQVTNGRRALAQISTTFYGHPAQKLKVIGVTGTNGKTTTTYLIENILSHAGYKTGLIGTIAYKINGRVYPAGRTTPESVQLQSLLREMLDNGVQYVVMEVSSHALALERVTGCEFDVAVFTNITQDHFDFHGTFENYLETKTKLFSSLGQGVKPHPFAVINVDDPSSEYIIKHTPPAATVITYGLEQQRAQFRALRQHWDARGTQLHLLTPAGERDVNLKIPGLFNVYNALAAFGVVTALGVDLSTAIEASENFFGVPGHYEYVDVGQDFYVMIDFAHNPDALKKVLIMGREVAPNGRLLLVFGAEGAKDRLKRPIMGAVAARYSDWAVITSDNLYHEDPWEIAREVEKGLLQEGPPRLGYEIIVDRREAIERALRAASPGDIVIIAGKGHETSIIVGDTSIPFNDREVVEEILGRLLRESPSLQRAIL